MDFIPKRTLSLGAIITALVSVIAFLGYYAYDLKQQVKADVAALETKQQQLQRVYTKLDSISNVLEEKILKIKQLGGKVDGLEKIKKQLEKEKYELKLAKKIPNSKYQKIIAKIHEYELMLVEKDNEIVKLRELNEQLANENNGLKQQTDSMQSQIETAKSNVEDLDKKIKAAAILKVTYILVQAVDVNNKVRAEAEYKSKHIDILRFTFRFDDNKIAEHGKRKLYFKIINPQGVVIDEPKGGGGTFTENGQEYNYTASQETLFNNNGQPFIMDYQRGKPFESGQYLVEIFCDGAKIGQTNFVVK
jgi:archaellum component FlaC